MGLPPDRNIGPVLIWLTAVLDIVAVSLTGLRLWIRRKHRNLGGDDWTILISLLIANARMVFQILQSFHGNGRHKVYLTDEQYTISAKWGWYAQLALFGGNCFCKISICLLILRIKETKFLKRLLWSVIAGLVITNGTFEIMLLAECSPVNAYWRPQPGACWTPKVRIYTVYVVVAYGVIVDFMLSGLPANIIWHLQMPTKKKLLVSGLMSLGLVATGFGIARAASLGISTEDLTWTYCIVAIWSNLELWLAIICANLALGRSMLAFVLRRSGDADDSAVRASPYDYHGNTGFSSNHNASERSRQRKKRELFGISMNTMMSTRDRTHNEDEDGQAVWSDCRRTSTQSATASDMPLDSKIHMTTEVYMREDTQSEIERSGPLDSDGHHHGPFNAI